METTDQNPQRNIFFFEKHELTVSITLDDSDRRVSAPHDWLFHNRRARFMPDNLSLYYNDGRLIFMELNGPIIGVKGQYLANRGRARIHASRDLPDWVRHRYVLLKSSDPVKQYMRRYV